MNTKKKVFLYSTIVLMGLLAVTVIMNQFQTSKIDIHGNYVTFNSLEELEQFSDLIIIGSPVEPFNKRKHKETRFEDGNLESFSTLTKLDIKSIIKKTDLSLNNESSLEVVEPVGLIKEGLGKRKLTIEGYSEMKENLDYLIFLKMNSYGEYSVVANTLGRYNLDGKDLEDSGNEEYQEKKASIKTEALKKYVNFVTPYLQTE
ncbi:hypothetical protein [Paenibacillus sp. 32O-W]|uniref:hypothetical protein n=1 Tax=Paenibacillus sp. 32O-W TaxID=1695218 RepID=UPI0011AA6F6E|nr:hypothetical protein [Paenibacillus sp. 32O-W]